MKKLDKKASSLSDREYIYKSGKIYFGKKFNLDSPTTFNEKLNWLKLNDRKDIYTSMVDKHEVKQIIKEKLGEKYCVKELGAYDSFDEIDFSKLPNSFVLKTTHGCRGMYICKDKSFLDIGLARNILEDSLSHNYFLHRREWPYKNVKPRIIAEELLIDNNHEVIPVIKFFCCSGTPVIAQVIQNDKQPWETIDYVDMEWNKLKIKQNFPNSKHQLKKPQKLDLLIGFCKKLSKNFPFLRCDFYVVNEEVFFSEFTFYSDAGLQPFYPKKWDIILGNKIDLGLC